MSKLSSVLKPLIGLKCSLDEIQHYFTSKGASVDGRTDNTIYLEVTTMRQFLNTGTLRLPTSIIASVDDGKITFINASVSYF
jgi:hypothetical protein